MTQFNHGAFVKALRERMGSIPQKLYDDLMYAVDAALRPSESKLNIIKDGKEPAWLTEARRHIGLKEIAGPKHNKTILDWIKALGGWFTDDETPWCGTFVAQCLKKTGYAIPTHWYRALEWKDWAAASDAHLGAIAVFKRDGGGHVGFIVGQSKDNWYILGGNQSNMVCIQPIAKARCVAIRSPIVKGEALAVPQMTGGTVSKNEA